MYRLTLVLPLVIMTNVLIAQISGIVKDESGVPLPYVNIHVNDSDNGTSTNNDGEYLLNLEAGNYELIFKYVGYKSNTASILITQEPMSLDITLKVADYRLNQVVISANAEDPAYAIIRKAQKNRKANEAALSNYQCDAYVRGFNKILDAPEKIMGQKVGDFEGSLDSTRQGVVYLSESLSHLYYKNGKSKEVLYSSKVSGDDQGYSFNSAQEMNFNFYNNSISLNKELISPIAKNAMNYYNYQLVGAQYDEGGQLVNKIRVIPKNEFSNTFYGHIYINEDLWNINSLALSATKKATGLPIIDTLTFTQSYEPNSGTAWTPSSNIIDFRMGAFGFKVGGKFACVYSNYELGTVTAADLDKVVYEVLEESNDRSDAYWDTLRPIPLTQEEKTDYHRKDSIRIIRESPAYLDSVDRVHNKFDFSDILSGYNHRNSQRKSRYAISSPLGGIKLNTIQGWHTNLAFNHTKRFTKENGKILRSKINLNYGLSEKIFRPQLRSTYLFGKSNSRLTLIAGRKLVQYNSANPISDLLNSLTTFFDRKNYLKAYDKKHLSLAFYGYVARGISLNIFSEYANRSALINNYNGGLQQDARNFTSNNPQDARRYEPAFSEHQVAAFGIELKWEPAQKLVKYPNAIFRQNSDWPTFRFAYKGAIRALSGDVNFHLLTARINKRYQASIYGEIGFNLIAGKFVGNRPEEFIDYYHFMGNQTHIVTSGAYLGNYLLLPYYDYSTNDHFIQLHLQHNFKGYLLSKIPLLKRLEWRLVGGYKLLDTESYFYDEIHIGLDNIGFGLFRFLRIDMVFPRLLCNQPIDCSISRKPQLVFGLNLSF